MKKIMLIAFLISGTCASIAQRRSVTEALNAIKAEKPDFELAETKIKEALVNDESKNDARTFYAAGLISFKKYEEERNKKILKQKVDEGFMYTSLDNAFSYWTKCLEIDKMPDAKGKVKPKFDKELKQTMKENANDYINAGGYYFDLKDYKMAHKYFSTYANFPKTDALKDANIQADPNYKMIPFYASMAALNLDDPQMAINALETAKSVDYEKYRVHYFLTEAYKKGGNKEKYIEATKEAFTAFPDSIYFLANLVNHYITNKDYDNAISFLKTGLSKKSDLNLMVALSEVLIEAKKPDEETKEILQKAMQLYPNAAQPYYYSGHLLLKKAMEMTNKANEIKINKKYQEAIQAIKPIYSEALPLFLKATELTDNKNIEYLKPIRSIYYNLGKDKEFKQYDALIQALEKK